MSAEQFVGRRCSGFFKTFNLTNGWGFLKCPKFSEDVFVSYKTSPALTDIIQELANFGPIEGQACSFTVQQSKSNSEKYEAIEVGVSLFGSKGQSKGNFGPAAKGQGKKGNIGPTSAVHLAPLPGKGLAKGKGKRAAGAYVGQRCRGFIKSFNATKGWGFINSGSFPEDVFVSFKTSPELADLATQVQFAGEPVSFLLANSASNPGQYEAREVMLDNVVYEDAPPEGQVCRGHVKSFNATKGWGFLRCPDVGADIFVSYKTAPELVDIVAQGPLDGKAVSFTLCPSKSTPGAFEATSLTVLGNRPGGGKGKSRSQPY
eukprot:TRINITY_DN662_c0_g1_i1.p1 TRINITY_DN662_c0_g1~~TRINITY_DN662_c0_g1_i1.p1  ORF type:complete len:317 (+),score=45.09 TRINITY_DN662_c0_g1_i1:48-998(+)